MASNGFGENVRVLREKRGWGQQELAAAARLSQPAISRIERGLVRQPRLAVIKRLSEALGVTADFLIEGHGGASITGDAEFIVAEVKRAYDCLGSTGRKQLLNYVRFLAQEAKRRNHRKARR